MLKIAVLGSTRGTDLQPLLEAQAQKTLGDAEIVLVISNNPAAEILNKARLAGVEDHAIDTKDRADFEDQVLALLQRRNIDLILLIGFMRILSEKFVKAYDHKILNVHPSLLPKYAGGMNMNVHEEVLKNKDAVTGCTLHYVTANVDEGPIYAQKEVSVAADDTADTLKAKVQLAEQELLLQAVRDLANQHVDQTGTPAA
jgi:formyltetrahydrofolate-dependent phosphoribosylglycinamide formyltransferase